MNNLSLKTYFNSTQGISLGWLWLSLYTHPTWKYISLIPNCLKIYNNIQPFSIKNAFPALAAYPGIYIGGIIVIDIFILESSELT